MVPGSDDKPRIASMMLSSPPETPDLNEIINYLKGQTIPESGESVYEHVVKQAADQTALEANLRYYYWIEKTIELVKCDPDIGPPLPEEKPERPWSTRQVMFYFKIPEKSLLKLLRTDILHANVINRDGSISPVTPGRLREHGLEDVLFDRREVCEFKDQHPDQWMPQKKKSKAQRLNDRDIDRIAQLMEKIKKRSPKITDKRLVEVIYWALSVDKPAFPEADKFDWVLSKVPSNFERPRSEDWIEKKIRAICEERGLKKKPGRPSKV